MAVSPIVTPPKLIDSTLVQYYATDNCFSGPFDHSGDLYAALFDIATVQVQVAKSTDNGDTWSRVDDGSGATIITAGAIPVFGSATLIVWLLVALDSGGASSANFIDAQDFDMGSDLFSALVAEPTANAVGSGRTFGVYRSDGSILMLYPLSAGNLQAWASVYNAGFGTGFLVDSQGGEDINPIGLVVDSSDVSHVITFDSNTSAARYLTVDAADAVLGPSSVPSISSATGVLDRAASLSGALAYPYVDGSGPHLRVKVLCATGATVNPATASWTVYDGWTGTLEATSEDSSAYALFDGSDLTLFWINTTALGISRVYSAKFNGGGFDAPVVFYDSSLYPPVGSTQDPTMQGLSVVNLGGSFVGIVGMNIDGTANQTFYLKAGGAVQSGYRNRLY